MLARKVLLSKAFKYNGDELLLMHKNLFEKGEKNSFS